MTRKELEGLSREELITRAEGLGVVRPRSLTIPELIDDILKASDRKTGGERPRGWFGRARDLLTSVIDRGLAPEPRSRRTEGRPIVASPPPLPTVTLAEIYAAQGHTDRAIATLDEVLAKEPTHAEAQRLRLRFVEHVKKTKPSTPPPVIEASLEPVEPVEPTAPATAAPEAPPPPVEAPIDEPVEATTSFEVDEIVALAVDPTTIYLYWEVRPITLARAKAQHPDGALTVRAATVVARGSSTVRDVRDVRVDALFGELFVHGMAPQANVRVSVGYKHAGGFEPFAVGIELATPRAAAATEVGTSFRRFSDPAQPLAGARRPPAAAGNTGPSPETTRGQDALIAKFPSGVWVDPATRLVIQTDLEPGLAAGGEGETGHRVLVRASGSSDILRRTVVWASHPNA
jgi:hypothetical protein